MLRSLTPAYLARRLRDDWASIGLTRENSDREWTQTLLDWFRKEGLKLGCLVYPDPALGLSEYLFDMAWTYEQRPAKELGAYLGIVLALESEWSASLTEVIDDFDKLLDVRADVKVMICSPSKSQLSEAQAAMSMRIRQHQRQSPDDRYLVIAFVGSVGHTWALDNRGEKTDLGALAVGSTP